MKKMIALLLALVMAFALVACGGQENNQTSGNEEGSDKILIGAIYRDLTQTWFEKESTAAKATADELGIDILIGDGQEDPAVLIDVLDSFITQGIQGLVINTCDQGLSQTILDKCAAAGIPVCAVDVPLIDDNGTHIAPAVILDSYLCGQQTVEWLLKHPLSDGGTFTGVADIVSKYGLVPKCAMPETNSSENTARMANLISLKLKEYALRLRDLAAKGAKPAALEKEKTAMLGTVYRMLVLNLGVPPTEFDYVRTDAQGNPVETEHHTPMSFLEKYGDKQLLTNYVMLMNDPSREYYKCYEIDYDRHRYDGKNWTYVNLPVEDIKQMAIASLKDSTMMYFSCDVGKFLDSERGLLDVKNYDYESLMGTTFGMDKKQRIQTFSSGSSHAMTLMAVDLDKDGKPVKWMVENSWGADSGYKGHLIMTDEWFDEYMFRLVVETKYVPAKIMELFKQKPVRLPAWDPMFAND